MSQSSFSPPKSPSKLSRESVDEIVKEYHDVEIRDKFLARLRDAGIEPHVVSGLQMSPSKDFRKVMNQSSFSPSKSPSKLSRVNVDEIVKEYHDVEER